MVGADPRGADEAVFGMRVLGPNLALRWLHAYLGGAVIYLEDPEPASITRFEVGSGWIGANDVVTVEASDPGLGVRTVELQTPAGAHTRTHWCLGDRTSRCPAAWSQDFSAGLLPEGEIELTARAADVLGQATTSGPREARVDRTAPGLELSGSLHEASGGHVEDGLHTLRVHATDGNGAIATSGVRSVKVLADGERRAYREHDCPGGGCELEHELELDAAGLSEGAHEVSVQADDWAGNETVEAFSVSADRTAPGLALSGGLWARRAAWLEGGTLGLEISATDAASGVVSAELVIDGIRRELVEQPCPEGGCSLEATWSVDVGGLDEGRHLVQVLVLDASGRLSQESWVTLVDRSDPTVELSGPLAELEGEVLPSGEHSLDVAARDLGSGVRSVEILLDDGRVDLHEEPCEHGACAVDRSWTLDTSQLDEGQHTVRIVVRDEAGRQTTRDLGFEISNLALPEAPQLDDTRSTSIGEATSFLYEGPDAIQTGVAEGTIVARRAAVLRGVVSERDGAPLGGVSVSVVDRPEYGSTLTRADGEFYIAVNGGETLTVRFERDGYLSAERSVDVDWQDWAFVEDVALVRLDGAVTQVDLSEPLSPPQVARGSQVTDGDGSRRATLFFQPATEATMVLPDGTTQALTQLSVRATEYTVGPNGEDAMPAELPPTSGYTYAAEFSVDEALAAGAQEVHFSRPVVNYTENFIGFDVGSRVPTGYYDRTRSRWVPSRDGRIIEVLSEEAGAAVLDVDGSGTRASADALDALGVTDAELGELADLYEPGAELWRLLVDHFTPWDHNWPYGPPPDAVPPTAELPPPPIDDQCQQAGSVIGCENQSLGEELPITGTPFTLNYRSERTPGYGEQSGHLNLPVTGDPLPPGLKGVRTVLEVAGRSFDESLPAAPNQRFTFQWDGEDAFGRAVQGTENFTLSIGYVYEGAGYQSPAEFQRSFAVASGVPIGRGTRNDIVLWQTLTGTLGPRGRVGCSLVGPGWLDPRRARCLEVSRAGELPMSADYDVQDRITRYGGATYTYTPAGDLASKSEDGRTTEYEYDELGALTDVTLPSGTQIDYVLGADGERIAKKRDGEVEYRFLYGTALGPVAELNPDGTVRTRFVYATRANVPDYMVRAGRTYRIVTDQLGSPRSVVDAESGTVVQEIDYDEFGRITRDTNPGFQPFGFTGGLYDADTGLVRLGARDYDPETGRWSTKDPIGFAGGDPNLYGYVVNDPINLTDPSGLLFGYDITPPFVDDAAGWVGDRGADIGDAAESGYEAVTNQAQESLEYWADLANDECASDLARGFANVAGPLAALGTEENLPTTAATLATGGIGGGIAGGVRYSIAYHSKPHPFGFLGRRHHIQLLRYVKGQSGSGRRIQIPLP